jgi:hypothetical protein
MSRDATSPMDESVQETAQASLPVQSMPTARERRSVQWIKNALWTSAFIVFLLAVLAAYGFYRFGSINALVAALQGRVLYVEPTRISVGTLKPSEQATVKVRLRNLTENTIKVLGSRSSCGCLVTSDLPVTLASGEVKEVSIHLTAPSGDLSEFEHTVIFYLSVAGEQPWVVLHGQIRSAKTVKGKPK